MDIVFDKRTANMASHRIDCTHRFNPIPTASDAIRTLQLSLGSLNLLAWSTLVAGEVKYYRNVTYIVQQLHMEILAQNRARA